MSDWLVVRTPSGLSGDMFAAGLARLLGLDTVALAERVRRIGLPALHGAAVLEPRSVRGIVAWGLRVNLPDETAHRPLAEIAAVIDASALAPAARRVARATFERLAEVEGEIHGVPPERVHFHEVGALDSILDICLTAELHAEMGSPAVACSPLPVSDGQVRCQHGLLATPAPAVLRMLEGVPVYGVSGAGETVTPTALALLHALDTRFGEWPAMTVRRTARTLGTRILPGVPNGALFAWGAAACVPVDGRAACSPPGVAAGEHHHPHRHDPAHDNSSARARHHGP